jgi:hypothetical protein
MLIGLHKSFSFSQDEDTYQVGYVFEKDVIQTNGLSQSDISLTVTFSKNDGGIITDKTNKASSILSQSNESIEKSIRTKILSLN